MIAKNKENEDTLEVEKKNVNKTFSSNFVFILRDNSPQLAKRNLNSSSVDSLYTRDRKEKFIEKVAGGRLSFDRLRNITTRP